MASLLELPFNDPLFRAQQLHREHFDPNAIQISTLLSIKTGGCEEHRKYFPQSANFDTGLDYDKHNPGTDPAARWRDQLYPHSTRTRLDGLETLERARNARRKICAGGIVGMGETRHHRADPIVHLANLEPDRDSAPINNRVRIEGMPLESVESIDYLGFRRAVAVARVCIPQTMVRPSAGREHMPETMQSPRFPAGANSIFRGSRLLAAGNPQVGKDRAPLDRRGMHSQMPA